MNELISIIIPVYNGENYINRMYNCLVNQTYTNIEIIFVNDGSTDNSKEILENCAEKDKRIKFINKIKNTGVSETKNIAIDNVSGKYILFVDIDDVVSHNIVEILYKNIKKYNADISSCDLEKVYDNNLVFGKINNEVSIFNKKESILAALKGKKLNMFTTAKLYKTELFDNIRFPENMKMIEDAYISCELLLKSNMVVYTSDKLYKYIFRDGSLMNSSFSIENELNIIEVQKRNAQLILEVYPELNVEVQQRILWGYFRFFDRLLLSEKIDENMINKYKKEIYDRKKYVFLGDFFNIKRKISTIILFINLNLYKKLINRKGKKLF
ncbi:glycosyltransferase [Helcococcus bovis]|uniref:glycosyltransferase family 2 protein n=1 Tax=Helcococcus bovis TaxID=3153252 RepID=UPI0038BD3E6B